MATSDAAEAFLGSEYAQAWDHYRHTETQRLQYLGFFFTASLGSAALAVPLFASPSLTATQRTVAIGFFALIFQTVTFFVFVSVHRFGRVLAFYLDAMTTLRHERATLAGVDGPVARTLDVREHPGLSSTAIRFSVQKTAERILLSTLALDTAIALGAVAASLATNDGRPIGVLAVTICTAAAGVAVIMTWISARALRKGRASAAVV